MRKTSGQSAMVTTGGRNFGQVENCPKNSPKIARTSVDLSVGCKRLTCIIVAYKWRTSMVIHWIDKPYRSRAITLSSPSAGMVIPDTAAAEYGRKRNLQRLPRRQLLPRGEVTCPPEYASRNASTDFLDKAMLTRDIWRVRGKLQGLRIADYDTRNMPLFNSTRNDQFL